METLQIMLFVRINDMDLHVIYFNDVVALVADTNNAIPTRVQH